MADGDPTKSTAGNAAGVCSMGCASIFILAGVIWPLLHALGGTLDENILMFFPLLIGLPCFLIGNVLALFAVSSSSVSAGTKRWGKCALIAMWGSIAAFIVILIAADLRGLKTSDVAGVYDGAFGGISEVLELRQNGTFVQTLKLSTKDEIATTGRWEIQARAVILEGYLVFYDLEHNHAQTPPSKTSRITYAYGSKMLIRGEGSHIYTSKRR